MILTDIAGSGACAPQAVKAMASDAGRIPVLPRKSLCRTGDPPQPRVGLDGQPPRSSALA